MIQKKLGLKPDVVTYDNQDVIKSLHNKFEGEIINTQYSFKSSHVALTGPTRQQVLQLMITRLESKLAQTHVALIGPTRQQVL